MSRALLQQALDALKFAYNECASDWVMDEKIDPAINALESALAQPEPDLLPGWVRAADDEMVAAHLGVANLSDSYASAKAKLAALIEWHVAVATDPAANGGLSLQPAPAVPLTDEPEPEPVAWTWDTEGTGSVMSGVLNAHFQFTQPAPDKRILNLTPLYTHPHSIKPISECSDGEIYSRLSARDHKPNEPELFGWMVSGVPTVMRGSLAEAIQKNEAKRIGGTCVAFPVYVHQKHIVDANKKFEATDWSAA